MCSNTICHSCQPIFHVFIVLAVVDLCCCCIPTISDQVARKVHLAKKDASSCSVSIAFLNNGLVFLCWVELFEMTGNDNDVVLDVKVER